MAKRGSSKDLSLRHEDHVAQLFDGKRSRSSGAADHDAGDVRTSELLIECKMTMAKPPAFVRHMEKITKEAWEEGRSPILALRYFSPDSLLADANGWIDLIVMIASDCAEAEKGQRVDIC